MIKITFRRYEFRFLSLKFGLLSNHIFKQKTFFLTFKTVVFCFVDVNIHVMGKSN